MAAPLPAGAVVSGDREPYYHDRSVAAQPVERPAWPPLGKAAAPAGPAATPEQPGGFEPGAEQQLRPNGRVSLAVDFPSEGGFAHFKKLKANAALDLWISRPSAFERLGWLVKFAVLALVLGLVCAAWDRWGGKGVRQGR